MKTLLKFVVFPVFILAIVIVALSRFFFKDLPREFTVKTVLWFLED